MASPTYCMATKARQQLKELIVGATDGGSLTIGTGRVFLGWRGMPDDSLFKDAQDHGPFVMVGQAQGITVQATLLGGMQVPLILYVAKPKGLSWDGVDVDELVASILRAIVGRTDRSGPMPSSVSVTSMYYDTSVTEGVLAVSMVAQFENYPSVKVA